MVNKYIIAIIDIIFVVVMVLLIVLLIILRSQSAKSDSIINVIGIGIYLILDAN